VGATGAAGTDGPHTGGISNSYTAPAFVGGGEGNTASGAHSTVAGGKSNDATNSFTSIAGGELNTASGAFGAVGGGRTNSVTGLYGTVPGGQGNTAAAYSLAAGRAATSSHTGSFVWSDSLAAAFGSSVANQFAARAANGFWFGKTGANAVIPGAVTINTDTGAFLTNGGVWTNASDVNRKEGFTDVDKAAVLAKLIALPITSWKYKVEEAGIRHIGPTSQDFRNAFGLGISELAIGTLDADGVALVSIQALAAQVAERDTKISELEERLAALEDLLDN